MLPDLGQSLPISGPQFAHLQVKRWNQITSYVQLYKLIVYNITDHIHWAPVFCATLEYQHFT